MYLQTGNEHLWLAQKRQSLEAEAASRSGAVGKSRAATGIGGGALDRAAGMTAGLAGRLVRSSLVGVSLRCN